MRKFSLLLLFLLLLPTTVFAQRDRDDDWRRRRPVVRENTFELTPFIGYRWGGTIFADQTFIFGQDVQVEPSANIGISLGVPLGDSGMKLELLADRQASQLETGGGLFEPEDRVADIDVTYLHAGLQIPFARSRNVTPYVVVSAGLANLDPQISGVSAENRFSASAGLGVKAPIGRNLSFKFEGRGFYTALEENDDCFICDNYYNQDFYQGEVSLGLVFSF
ncbi:MAG TPA: outer membrane beta-barrel protein [Thermoanaerobaculia bacterium]|nr:outer membrane beta-barrel protein [Thermoanaerobaculia bacterium]